MDLTLRKRMDFAMNIGKLDLAYLVGKVRDGQDCYKKRSNRTNE